MLLCSTVHSCVQSENEHTSFYANWHWHEWCKWQGHQTIYFCCQLVKRPRSTTPRHKTSTSQNIIVLDPVGLTSFPSFYWHWPSYNLWLWVIATQQTRSATSWTNTIWNIMNKYQLLRLLNAWQMHIKTTFVP